MNTSSEKYGTFGYNRLVSDWRASPGMATSPFSGPIEPPYSQANSEKQGSKCKRFMGENWLTIATFLAVCLGIGIGFGVRESAAELTPRQIMYINFPGELFLRMLKGLILPLIVSSLVSAIGSLDTSLSGKIGVRAVVYYMATTVLAIVLGIVLVTAIRPGKGDSSDLVKDSQKGKTTTTADTLLDLVRNMFPPNIIEACFAQYSTSLTMPPPTWVNESSENETYNMTKILADVEDWKIGGGYGGGTNILGLVVFSVVLGVVLGRMGEPGKPLLAVFTSLGNAMMVITKYVIWLSPVGVLFLVLSKILEMDNLQQIAGQLGMYTVTVLVGLLIHGLVTLPAIYVIFLRSPPFRFLSGIVQALTTAFATSSSSATLPVTFACLEEKNGIDPRISRFILPIGATINMDGTALYEAVAAIFIAQLRKVPLDAGKIFAISITATAASIGAAGIPQAGLVTMVMVLNAVGLPADDVALIFTVDWFLDRFRTLVNVLGDAIGAGVVSHLSKKDLDRMDHRLPDEDDKDSLKQANFKEVTTM